MNSGPMRMAMQDRIAICSAQRLLDGVLITQPSYEAEGCKIGLSLATDPQMRVIGADEQIPTYTIAWPNFIRTFTEVLHGA